MADDKRYMGFWIGHLNVSERNRIHAGGLNPHEREMLAKSEDPWAKFRGPLPPGIQPYVPPKNNPAPHEAQPPVEKPAPLPGVGKDREPTEAEVLAIMHDDDLLEYTSSSPSGLRRNSMFEFYKQQWKAVRAASERSKKVEGLRQALSHAPETKSGSSEDTLGDDRPSIAPEPREPKKYRFPIIVHLKEGLRWCASNLWSWTAVVITGPLLYGLGVGAMYGQQPIIAACLYFFAIGLILSKAIAEVRSHEHRIGVIVVVLILGTAVFGVSLLWIQHTSPDWLSSIIKTKTSSVDTSSPIAIPSPFASPSASGSPNPSPSASLKSPSSETRRHSKTSDAERQRQQKLLKDLGLAKPSPD